MIADPVIAALLGRMSVGQVTEPAPSAEQRDVIFRAALRAPDHGQLRPWRFLLVEGDDRRAMGELVAQTEEECFGPLTATQRSKAAARLLRAPLVLLIIARIVPHAKVPALEQQLSVAAAVQNMLVAAHALGVGAMWRTGPVTFEPLLADRLGLAANEQLLGFLYLGTPCGETRPLTIMDPADYFTAWKPV